MPQVLVIAGSKSDSKIVEKVTNVLKEISISHHVEYASAHREPERVTNIVKESDSAVIIAVAGLAAALPGFIASITERPVIGVPVSAALGGLDSLLSIAQMPKGVPVATVGIDNGQNAAYLAARILGRGNAKKPVPGTYAEAGVDEDKVHSGLEVLGKYVRESFKNGKVMQDYGHYANTVMVSDDLCLALATDGVGSKVMVAKAAEKYDTIGQDCVAMNVNDLICVGAIPVGFVDYLAVEKPLPTEVIDQIGKGLLEGCQQAGVPILGGETAVLPDIIRGSEGIGFDLAGTAVGIVKPNDILDGSAIQDSDVLIGIPSNGLHSNGYTLARRIIFSKYDIHSQLPWGVTVAEEMLKPTRIYVPHFKMLKSAGVHVRGIAHITGTGFHKILRLKKAKFVLSDFPEIPPVFSLIKDLGAVEWKEMFSTFNMGIGLVLVVPAEQSKRTIEVLQDLDRAYLLGHVQSSEHASVEIQPFEVEIS